MPRGQKECPKCGKTAGPRTKVCDICHYVYLQDSVDKITDGVEISAKVGKKQCSNCSRQMESTTYNIDPYGKITYFYRWGDYCGTGCLEAASERKDDLILEILNKIKEFDNEELNSFILDKRKEEDYRSLIEDVEKRGLVEAEEHEYRKTHPYIVHVTNPVKRITTPDECREAGLHVPPKIGDHKPSILEEDDNPLKRLLNGSLSIEDLNSDDENIESEEDLDSEDSEDSESEEDLEDSENQNTFSSLSSLLKNKGENEKDLEVKPSSLSNLLSGLKGLNETPKSSISTGIVFDSTSKPRQGQKKCRGCGSIVGVRTKICKDCNYKF